MRQFHTLLALLTLAGITTTCKFMREGARCDLENNCAYGCHNDRCWSECNGICCLTIDCFGEEQKCTGACSIPEWCYVKGNNWDGYQKCSFNSECNKENIPGPYKCGSSCTA
ncbi:hypothetical protein ACHWQZ_G018440 [Mnemiopsis leidyi]